MLLMVPLLMAIVMARMMMRIMMRMMTLVITAVAGVPRMPLPMAFRLYRFLDRLLGHGHRFMLARLPRLGCRRWLFGDHGLVHIFRLFHGVVFLDVRGFSRGICFCRRIGLYNRVSLWRIGLYYRIDAVCRLRRSLDFDRWSPRFYRIGGEAAARGQQGRGESNKTNN